MRTVSIGRNPADISFSVALIIPFALTCSLLILVGQLADQSVDWSVGWQRSSPTHRPHPPDNTIPAAWWPAWGEYAEKGKKGKKKGHSNALCPLSKPPEIRWSTVVAWHSAGSCCKLGFALTLFLDELDCTELWGALFDSDGGTIALYDDDGGDDLLRDLAGRSIIPRWKRTWREDTSCRVRSKGCD